MGRHVWKRREQRDTSKMPREDDEEDDAEEDDDATGQCSESVDNGMMFCEEVLSSLKMTWGPLCLVYRGRTKTPVSSFSILGGRNSWPRYENGDFIAKLEKPASFWNEGLSPAPISHFPPGSDQLSRNSCRGGNHPRFSPICILQVEADCDGFVPGDPPLLFFNRNHQLFGLVLEAHRWKNGWAGKKCKILPLLPGVAHCTSPQAPAAWWCRWKYCCH